MVPIDFSGHRSSGIAALGYAGLRRHLAEAERRRAAELRVPTTSVMSTSTIEWPSGPPPAAVAELLRSLEFAINRRLGSAATPADVAKMRPTRDLPPTTQAPARITSARAGLGIPELRAAVAALAPNDVVPGA